MEGAGPFFEQQCRAFFERQLEIVRPSLIIVMGGSALSALHDFEPKVYVSHPSACRDAMKRAAQIPRKVSGIGHLAELAMQNSETTLWVSSQGGFVYSMPYPLTTSTAPTEYETITGESNGVAVSP
jgi:hypothetical protein